MVRRLVLSELSGLMGVLLSELLVISGGILIAVQWPWMTLPIWMPIIWKIGVRIYMGSRWVNVGRPWL